MDAYAPDCPWNRDAWGPAEAEPENPRMAFSLFNKAERNWKIADFSYQNRPTRPDQLNKEGFEIVDNIGMIRQKKSTLKKRVYRPYQPNPYQQRFQRRNVYIKYDPSITIKPMWKLVHRIPFSDLTKITGVAPEVSDLETRGRFRMYNESVETLHPKRAVLLPKATKKYSTPSTRDDEVIQNLTVSGAGSIFATDEAIAQLVCCTRSVYPWDILVSKVPGGFYFFYSRSTVDLHALSVWETAQPNDKPNLTTQQQMDDLSTEATELSDALHEYMNSATPSPLEEHKGVEAAPFDLETEEVPDIGYKYRLFSFADGRKLVMRTQVHGVCRKGDALQPYVMCLLNEWNDNVPQSNRFSERLQRQAGAVLHKEMKLNSFRTAKIACEATFSGAEQIKIGYVTRRTISDPKQGHRVLGVQGISTKMFADQMNLSMSNVWGTLQRILEAIETFPDGRYMIFRDPARPVLEFYDVPEGTLDDDEEGDDEEGAEYDEEESDSEEEEEEGEEKEEK